MSTKFPKVSTPSFCIPSRTKTNSDRCYNETKKYNKGVLMTSMNDALKKYSQIKKETQFDWLYPPLDWCYRSDKFIPPARIAFTANLGKETTFINTWNYERTQLMKRREFNRLTSATKKPIYGTKSEKETYRKNIREVLLYQMNDKDKDKKSIRITLADEFRQFLAKDIIARENETKMVQERTIYLKKFRDANKKLMEEKWTEARETRRRDITIEKDMLKLDPINWSHTLT